MGSGASMRNVLFCALALIVSSFVNGEVVGARIVTCKECKLNRLPEVRRFIQEELPRYSALEVKYVRGKSPTMVFLEETTREASLVDLSDHSVASITALLSAQGITKSSPKPQYSHPLTIKKTKVCKAWRETRDCDPDGLREPQLDRHCKDEVPTGHSGYCQCRGDDKQIVRFNCKHRTIRCEQLCEGMVGKGRKVTDEL